MTALSPLDLRFQGLEHEIASYLVETDDGLALHDCGPASTVPELHARLAERGLELRDVRHLLLSHVHLDHAGAAGALVREHPGLTVWVSEIGAPHLVDPSKLESSSRRLFPNFDELWGAPEPVPEANVRVARGTAVGWGVFPSPGHASHHVCYERDGTILAGDACGVRIVPSSHVQPVAPPPEVDVDAWHTTIDEVERRAPERLTLTHFGVVEDVPEHLARLREGLDTWSARVRDGMSEDAFVEAVRADVGDDADRYAVVVSFALSYLGFERYWRKLREAATASG